MKQHSLLLAKPLRLRGFRLAALAATALAWQVGCSAAEESSPAPPPFNGTSGTSSKAGSSAGGGSSTAGTTSGGTFSAAGSGAGTAAGGTFSSSGSATGGAGGDGAAGSTAAGTAGTGGAPEPAKPFCDTQTLEPLPYTVNSGFQLSQWSPEAIRLVTANGNITPPLTNACATGRVAGAVGDCSMWRYTQDAAPMPLWIEWVTMWDPMYTHPPVCVAPGAKAVTFSAKGVKGGEKLLVSAGGGQQKKAITLTTEWATYSVSLANVAYNTFASGVTQGFAWEMAPTAETPTTEFFLDDLKWVAEEPTE